MSTPTSDFKILGVPPAGWLLVSVVPPDEGAAPRAKQRCLHPRRPFDKKCVDCPDKRAGR